MLIDRVKEHYGELCGEGRRHIDIPEWGEDGKPVRIFWEGLTLRDLRRVRRDNGEADFAELIVLKAEDESGQKLFDAINDAQVLRVKADALVVTRIGLAMINSAAGAASPEKN